MLGQGTTVAIYALAGGRGRRRLVNGPSLYRGRGKTLSATRSFIGMRDRARALSVSLLGLAAIADFNLNPNR